MMLNDILKTKTVSVWGLGYLGYTTILKLQDNGFQIVAYDIKKKQMKHFSSRKYPSKGQIVIWSRTGYVPKLNYKNIRVASNPKELFGSSSLHMIAMPRYHDDLTKEDIAVHLSDIFAKYLKYSKQPPLVIFESAFIPGYIEKYFVQVLEKKGLYCSKDYYLGAWFRTDWNIETFIDRNIRMPIGGYCEKSLAIMRELFTYLAIPTIDIGNLKEAEVYANSINAIQSMISDFVRQIALGYPKLNIRKLSTLLFKHIMLDDCVLNIGTGGKKMTFAIDNLICGSDNPEDLTLLKEFQNINISSVLNYAEYIKRHAYKSVTILGITNKGNQKDIVLSPTITMADYLIKNSVKVALHDPFCTKQEIRKLIKGAEVADFPNDAFASDVLVLATDHDEYKYLSQSMLDGIKKRTKLIIDNYGTWFSLSFGSNIKYHKVGDGSLDLAK